MHQVNTTPIYDRLLLLLAAIIVVSITKPVAGQETFDRRKLPVEHPKFEGKIGETYNEPSVSAKIPANQ